MKEMSMKRIVFLATLLICPTIVIAVAEPVREAIEKLTQSEALTFSQIRERGAELSGARALLATWLNNRRDSLSVEEAKKALGVLKNFEELYKKKLQALPPQPVTIASVQPEPVQQVVVNQGSFQGGYTSYNVMPSSPQMQKYARKIMALQASTLQAAGKQLMTNPGRNFPNHQGAYPQGAQVNQAALYGFNKPAVNPASLVKPVPHGMDAAQLSQATIRNMIMRRGRR